MITSYKQLKDYLMYEKRLYFPNRNDYFEYMMCREPLYFIWKYTSYLRKCEYYHYSYKHGHLLSMLPWCFYRVKKNRMGIKLGIEIGDFAVGKGLHIWHAGAIVINGGSSIGDNCCIHGAVCIGNNGKDLTKCPCIGNNVNIGVGAYIIGDVHIADNCKIGAGAIVVKSVYEEGKTILSNSAQIKK